MTDVITAPSLPEVSGAPQAAGEMTSPDPASVPEAPQEEATPVEKPRGDITKKFSALAKKEKQLRQREAELKSMEAKLAESNKPQAAPEEVPLDVLIKNNPLEALKKAGYSLEDILSIMASGDSMPKEITERQEKDKLQAKIRDLEEKLENVVPTFEKSQAEKEHAQVINTYKSELKTFVAADPDAYELVIANNAYDTIFDVIDTHYGETGKLLSEKEAADAVENYFYEEAMKLSNHKKLKKMFQPDSKDGSESEVGSHRQNVTLSNRDSSTSVVGDTERKLTREESLQRAAALLKWND